MIILWTTLAVIGALFALWVIGYAIDLLGHEPPDIEEEER